MFMVTFVPRELREAAAAEIVRLLDAGRLRHQIAGVFPLDDIVAAHELQETGRPIGKVLVKIADLE